MTTETTPTASGRVATMSPLDMERLAAKCCDAAVEAAAEGRYGAARVCYAEAEGWLWRADKTRGIDDGRPVLDARLELERLIRGAGR